MSDINSVTGTNDVLSQYGVSTKQGTKSNELGKDAFMELMIAQMKNQSPLDPQDNGQFISQLAQFSSLEGIQELNGTVNSVAGNFRSTQALQASAMVGRSVYVPADSAKLGASGEIGGFVDLPASTGKLTISIMNSTGELVRQIDLGEQAAGDVKFTWDGKNAKGDPMPAGQYSIKAEASYAGASEQVQSFLKSNVDSVSIAKNGALTLNLAGRGSVSLSDVRQIN